jgi:hypothetical protein
MVLNSLPRDYDIARIIADYEKRISFLERQLLGLAYLTPEFVTVQAARVTRNAVQSIPHNTQTAVQFNTEVFDPTGMHDNAVNNTRITIAVPGYYAVGFGAEMAAVNDYVRILYSITVNGGNRIVFQQMPAVAANVPQRHAISTMTQLVAGDYIEAEILHMNGAVAARNVTVNGNYSPVMYAARIGS